MFIIALSNILHIPYVHATLEYHYVTLTYDFDNNSKQGWDHSAYGSIVSTLHHSGSYSFYYCQAEGTTNFPAMWDTGVFPGTGTTKYFPRYDDLVFPANVIEANISFWWFPAHDSGWTYEEGGNGIKMRLLNNTVSFDNGNNGKAYGDIWNHYGPTSILSGIPISGDSIDIVCAWMAKKYYQGGWSADYWLDDIEIKYTYTTTIPVVLEIDPMYTQWIGTGLFLSGFIMFGFPIIVIAYKARERELGIRTLILLLTVVLVGFFFLISIGDLI
jgi:hypothetical protein